MYILRNALMLQLKRKMGFRLNKITCHSENILNTMKELCLKNKSLRNKNYEMIKITTYLNRQY